MMTSSLAKKINTAMIVGLLELKFRYKEKSTADDELPNFVF